MELLASHLNKIKVAGSNDKVYKDECVYSFDSPVSFLCVAGSWDSGALRESSVLGHRNRTIRMFVEFSGARTESRRTLLPENWLCSVFAPPQDSACDRGKYPDFANYFLQFTVIITDRNVRQNREMVLIRRSHVLPSELKVALIQTGPRSLSMNTYTKSLCCLRLPRFPGLMTYFLIS